MKIILPVLLTFGLFGSPAFAEPVADPLKYRTVIGVYVTDADGVPIHVMNDNGQPTGAIEGTTFVSPLSTMPIAWAAADASVAAVAVPWAKAWADAAGDDPAAAVVLGALDAR